MNGQFTEASVGFRGMNRQVLKPTPRRDDEANFRVPRVDDRHCATARSFADADATRCARAAALAFVGQAEHVEAAATRGALHDLRWRSIEDDLSAAVATATAFGKFN